MALFMRGEGCVVSPSRVVQYNESREGYNERGTYNGHTRLVVICQYIVLTRLIIRPLFYHAWSLVMLMHGSPSLHGCHE